MYNGPVRFWRGHRTIDKDWTRQRHSKHTKSQSDWKIGSRSQIRIGIPKATVKLYLVLLIHRLKLKMNDQPNLEQNSFSCPVANIFVETLSVEVRTPPPTSAICIDIVRTCKWTIYLPEVTMCWWYISTLLTTHSHCLAVAFLLYIFFRLLDQKIHQPTTAHSVSSLWITS